MSTLAALGLTPATAAGAAAAIAFAAVLRGFTGFGFALAAVPLASMFLPPSHVVATVLVMQAAIGMRDCIVEFRQADWRAVLLMVGGSLFGTPLGVLALAAAPLPLVRLALGALVCLAVVVSWRPRPVVTRDGGRKALLAGFCSGVSNGLAAMAGPPAIIYFLAFQPRLAVMRSSLMVFFPLAALLALPMVAYSGLLGLGSVVLAIFLLPVMVLGGWLGAWAFRRFGHRSYRPFASAALLLTAAATIAKGIAELLP
ncbi:MAG: sulfite exporter TauE/SafE family protein [Rhodospirillales bacterium]|nr:sulfite exporter TauE/SafE family protein [Rhodospirillales bacterium]